MVLFYADRLTPLSHGVQVTRAGKNAAVRSRNRSAVYTITSAGERLS
jgi:hypothetical protein